MATMTNPIETEITENQIIEGYNHFVVVHPLDDVHEEKVDTSALGPMPMTISVRLSLMSLRAYLVLMVLLVFYHVIDLARH
jgi:hypothetical protein